MSACSAGRTKNHGSCRRTATSIATRARPRNPNPFQPALKPCQSRAGHAPIQHPTYPSFIAMSALSDQITSALERYESDDNLGALFDALRALAKSSDVDTLIRGTEPFRERPEVVMPVYEHVVSQRPNDARALVMLANAYWLTGRGSDVVGELSARAKAADPSNRAAWHLWALSESNVRGRVERWRQVSSRFPDDQLARAALADNAASLAGAEHDPLALDLAIKTYESLWEESPTPTQRRALEQTLETLRGWKL